MHHRTTYAPHNHLLCNHSPHKHTTTHNTTTLITATQHITTHQPSYHGFTATTKHVLPKTIQSHRMVVAGSTPVIQQSSICIHLQRVPQCLLLPACSLISQPHNPGTMQPGSGVHQDAEGGSERIFCPVLCQSISNLICNDVCLINMQEYTFCLSQVATKQSQCRSG